MISFTVIVSEGAMLALLALIIIYRNKREIENLQTKWEQLRQGICPQCNEPLEDLLPKPKCPNCGILTPAYIAFINHPSKGIRGQCSFCGGSLKREKIEENSDGHVPGAGEPISVYTRPRCPDCNGFGQRSFSHIYWQC